MDSPSLRIVPYYSPTANPRGTVPRKRSQRARARERQNRTLSKIKNACILCREKKTRCSGHMPCIRCQQQRQTCQYMSTTSDHSSVGLDSGPCPSSYVTNHQIPDDSRQRALPECSTGIEISLRPVTPDDTPPEDQYGHFHGFASGFAFLQFAKQRLASLPSMSLDFSDYPLTNAGNLPSILPPKSVADDLIRDYFDFGLTTSRFVHKPSLLAVFDKLYNLEETFHSNQDDLVLAYMVMATGSHYSKRNSVFCGYSASVRFLTMAQKELQKESSKVTLSSLQARLLVTHYLLNHSRMHEAWSSFGIIVRQAQALRLQRKSTAPCTNHVDYEYRKRVFWSIYTYDRILSSIFGRPCALHDDDIDQEECALANDEGITVSECRTLEQGNFCSAAALIHYAQLARMLGRILREFYSPVAKRYSFHTLQQMASEIERDLGDWQDNLPVYLNYVSLPSSAMSTMTQRQTCTLKLTFAHTMLLLYRPFLLHWIRASDQISTNLESWFKHCGNKSVEAASMVVAECRDLYERGLFSRLFWLVNYVQFASIGTLYMYSCLWPHSSNVRATADEALAQFPTGVEGDLVGQRYLEILKELQEVTKGFNIGNVALDDQTILQSGNSFANEMPVFDGMLMSYGDPWGVGLFEATSLIDSL